VLRALRGRRGWRWSVGEGMGEGGWRGRLGHLGSQVRGGRDSEPPRVLIGEIEGCHGMK
jgi:hypothetical protein